MEQIGLGLERRAAFRACSALPERLHYTLKQRNPSPGFKPPPPPPPPSHSLGGDTLDGVQQNRPRFGVGEHRQPLLPCQCKLHMRVPAHDVVERLGGRPQQDLWFGSFGGLPGAGLALLLALKSMRSAPLHAHISKP